MENNVEIATNAIWRLIKKIAFWSLFLVASAYVLLRLRSILISVLVAVLLTYILLPWVDWLSRKRVFNKRQKLNRLISTIIVFIIFIAIISLAITLMVNPFRAELNDFVKNLGKYTDNLGKLAARVWDLIPTDVRESISKVNYSALADKASVYARQALSITTSSIGVAVELLLIPVLAFYFVLDYKTITREMYGLVPYTRRREALRIGRGIGEILQSYIFGQIILCLIAGVLTGIFLAVLHVPYIVVLALFAGITRAIPVIGPVVSGIPIVLVGLLNFEGPAIAIYLLVFVIVMHFAESKFIMPHLIGERLHLHPAMVIIVLLIGAEFFGIIGMFLAAPIAAIVRELIRFYYIRPRERAERRQRINNESVVV